MFVDTIISYINEFDNWEIIEQEENKIVAKKRGCTLTINPNFISWEHRYGFNSAEHQTNPIETNEENIKALLSMDWIPQRYVREFSFNTFGLRGSDLETYNILNKNYLLSHKFGILVKLAVRCYNDYFEETNGEGEIRVESVCSLSPADVDSVKNITDEVLYDNLDDSFGIRNVKPLSRPYGNIFNE